MNEQRLLRFLELVRRELSAEDVRAEIGGRDPDDPRMLAAPLAPDWRIVAVFAEPLAPADRAQLLEKLGTLVDSFAGISSSVASVGPPGSGLSARRMLDDSLDALVERAEALRAVVMDEGSPMLWGTSEARWGREDVESARRTAEACEKAAKAGVDLAELLDHGPEVAMEQLRKAELPSSLAAQLAEELAIIRDLSGRSGAEAWRLHLLTTRAIAAARVDAARAAQEPQGHPRRLVHNEEGMGLLARSFANIYWLVLVYDGPFSELHAEGAMLRALPVIERLVLSLPPVDPPKRGGRLVRMRRLREV